jgi:hypothetical protein
MWRQLTDLVFGVVATGLGFWGLFPHVFWDWPTGWIGLLLFAFGLHLVLITVSGAANPHRGGGLSGRRVRVRLGLLVLVAGWWFAAFAPPVMPRPFMAHLQCTTMACGCLTGFVLCLVLLPPAATGPSVVKLDRDSLAGTIRLVCSGLLVLGVGLGLFFLVSVPVPQRSFGLFCGSLVGFGVCLTLVIDPPRPGPDAEADAVEPLPLLKRVWEQTTEEERSEFLRWVKGADESSQQAAGLR